MGNNQLQEEDTMHLRSMITWEGRVAVEDESVECKEYNKKHNLKER